MMNSFLIDDERDPGNRYAAYIDGRPAGRISVVPVRDTVLITHIEVTPDAHDVGVGSLLMRRALDDIRAEGNTALALCPYARRWVDLHPSYRDVVRRPRVGETKAVAALVSADRIMRRLRGGS